MQENKSSLLHRFLTSPRYRLARHLMFIMCIAAISLSQNPNMFGRNTVAIGNGIYAVALVNFLVILLIAYFHIYFLVPRFLLNKKYSSYLLLSIISVLLLTTLKPLEEYFVNEFFGLPHLRESYFNGVMLLDSLSDFMLYMICISGASVTVMLKEWLAENRRRMELETKRLGSDVESIKQQANPALLLQTLRRAADFATEDPGRASELVLRQSKLLRYQLYDGNRATVPLKSEADFIGQYLRLESLSDTDFNYRLETDDKLHLVFIPPLLLIGIVQKIVKVSRKRNEAVSLNVRLELLAEGHISLECRVNVDIATPDFDEDTKRLKYIYKDNFLLSLRCEAMETVVGLIINTKQG